MANTGNTQQQINYGATANDGLGDPLRTAFIKTDENFDNIWLAGPVGSNITIGNNTIQVNNTNGNLILQPNGVGIVQANASVVPSANNIRDLGSSSSRWRRAYIQNLNIANLEVPGDALISGNLTVEGDTIQIGNIVTDTLTIQLANTAANGAQANGAGITVGANDDIATILYNSSDDRWVTNIGLTAPDIVVNSIRSEDSSFVTIADGITVDGPIDAAGTISATYFVGNGSLLTGIDTYSNANVASYLPVYSGNISAGNITVTNSSVTKNLEITKTGNTWYWNGALMLSPAGGSWFSNPDVQEEYISSGEDGYLTLQSLGAGPGFQIESEINLEHGKVRIGVYDGSNKHWDFQEDGTLDVPGDILPQANAVQSLGNVNLQWAELWVANNTIYLGGVPIGIGAGNVLTVGGEPILSNDSNTSITTTGDITAGNITATGAANINGEVYGQYFSLRGGNPTGTIGVVGYGGNVVELSGYEGVKIVAGSNEISPYWEFDTAGDLTAPGNIAANAILTDGYFYANGQPFVTSSIGNLEVTGTTIGIAGGATENTIVVGGTSGGLSVEPDANNPIVKLYANSGISDYFSQGGGDYTSGTYTAGGSGGTISLTGATNVVNYLNALQYTIVSLEINGGAAIPFTGGGWGGSTVNLDTTTPPSVDPTTVTEIVFNTVYQNRVVLDADDPDFGIYIGDENFDIQSLRDVRITSGDDLTLESDDGFSLRSNDTNGGINLTTDNNNNQYTWLFDSTGNLAAPGSITASGDIEVAGYITGTSGASTLVVKAQPDSNTYIQLNNTVNSTINTVANLEINTDVSNTARTWRFDTNGDLTAPNYIYFKDGTFIGDEGGAGIPVFRVDSPLGLGINLTTDSDISGNNYTWSFGIDGALSAPGNISTSSDVTANSFIGDGSQLTGLPASYGNANVSAFLADFGSNAISTTGNITAGNFTGNITITGNVTGTSSNVELVAGSYEWAFDDTGNLTLPGNTFAVNYANGTQVALGGGSGDYGDANVVSLLSSFGSNTISTTGNITAGIVDSSGTIYGNIDLVLGDTANASATKARFVTFGASSYIQTGNGITGSTGNIVFAPYSDATEKVVINTGTGDLTTVGNVTADNVLLSGNITGSAANVTITANSFVTTFDTTGLVTFPGDVIVTGNLSATGTDGNVVTRFESSWTVPTGNSTQSFTVDAANTYYMWVVGNIPNGIITWNATATVTNTNVPVVGAQYAWVYDGGGTPIDFTSLPNQFTGTANTIVRSNVAPSATTNRFDFGINNTSGSPQTVRYGWIRIS